MTTGISYLTTFNPDDVLQGPAYTGYVNAVASGDVSTDRMPYAYMERLRHMHTTQPETPATTHGTGHTYSMTADDIAKRIDGAVNAAKTLLTQQYEEKTDNMAIKVAALEQSVRAFPEGNLDMKGHTIINLADATGPTALNSAVSRDQLTTDINTKVSEEFRTLHDVISNLTFIAGQATWIDFTDIKQVTIGDILLIEYDISKDIQDLYKADNDNRATVRPQHIYMIVPVNEIHNETLPDGQVDSYRPDARKLFIRFTVTVDTDTTENMKNIQTGKDFYAMTYVQSEKDPMKDSKPVGFYYTITKQIQLDLWLQNPPTTYNVMAIKYLKNNPPTLVTPPPVAPQT